MNKILGFLALISLFSCPAFSKTAKPGGTFYLNLSAEPETLNPVTATDLYATEVQSWVMDTLLTRHFETYQWVPYVAKSWEIAKDGMSFTFTIRDDLKWSDGKPLTVEDVKYSFDVYFEGRFVAPHMQSYLENIKEAVILGPNKIKFVARNLYFKNFSFVAAGISLIPKHIYGVGDPKDSKFNSTLLGSGAYKLKEWDRGQKIVLERIREHWADKDPYFKQFGNFDRIQFRFIKDQTVAVEALKKGTIDFIEFSPLKFLELTKGPEWGSKVFAVKGPTKSVALNSYRYISWNQRNPLFADRKIRRALAHLINIPVIVDKISQGMAEQAVGPFGVHSIYRSPKVKPIEFSQREAAKIFKEEGWVLGKDGLEKVIDGKKKIFEFELLFANKDHEKYLTIFQQDMLQAGVKMKLKLVEFNTILKLVDERKFDAFLMGWGASVDPDPNQIFHSSQIKPPGQNSMSYSNPKLDAKIRLLQKTMDEKKRLPIYHEINEILMEDQPYAFLFNDKFLTYGVTARIGRFNDLEPFGIGTGRWWIETD